MLGEPLVLGAAPRDRRPLQRRAARGRHRDRPRADADRAAAPPRRRRIVRRVLRRRTVGALAGRPGDALEHVPGVRRDLCPLPRRRRDPPLPDSDRARRRGRARRALREGAGPLPARRRRRRRRSTTSLELDLASVEPSLAGPSRPQDRVALASVADSFHRVFGSRDIEVPVALNGDAGDDAARRLRRDRGDHVVHEHLEPVGHGRRRPARAKRDQARAPHEALGQDEPRARLSRRDRLPGRCRAHAVPRPARLPARRLRLHDLHRELGAAARRRQRGRAHGRAGGRRSALGQPQLRGAHPSAGASELPRLAAARGRLRPRRAASTPTSPASRSAPTRKDSRSTCTTCGRRPTRSRAVIERALTPDLYDREYGRIWDGDERWRALDAPTGAQFAFAPDSTYVREPPFFEHIGEPPAQLTDIVDARCLALLGDSVTTDHISPAGAIPADMPAGRYLQEHGVVPREFNSFGSRRGNHEVMVRGTFANIRLRNALADGKEGGYTKHQPSGELMSIYDAAERYASDGVPLVVLAGKEYGIGLVARLGGQGHAAPRRARRDRRELRAHPPLEPRRDGRAPARVDRRRDARLARPDGSRAVHPARARRPRTSRAGHGDRRRRRRDDGAIAGYTT